jgi:asparagine synthetase B (glutamine-hydrolysing)
MRKILISNIKNKNEFRLSKSEYYSAFITESNVDFFIKGYIQPRYNETSSFTELKQLDLLSSLHLKYQEDFIHHIKGVFTIIINTNNLTSIFTDHFGFSNLYIYQKNKEFAISDSLEAFKELNIELVPDEMGLIAKTLIHRVPTGRTLFKYITKTKLASHITIENNTLTIREYWSPSQLLIPKNKIDYSLDFDYFAHLIKSNFKNFLEYHKPQINTITLTGGKDSRTGLAALKANNADVMGFTYGNPNSRDAVYAQKLADKLNLSHHIFNPDQSDAFFEEYFNAIIKTGNSDISLHRAHRLFAFDKMISSIKGSTAYYAGYMAGEFLMGIYYDNLIFSKYLTHFWESEEFLEEKDILSKFFHKTNSLSKEQIRDYFSEYKCFDKSLSKEERQFWGLFEIGIPHHGQDVFLSSHYFDFVYPFFVDIDFLEKLFQSKYSFFFTDNKTKNLISRYKLFEFNLNIQHILFNEMDEVHFGKRGSYNTKEFLKGKYYWTAIKTIRYFFQRHKYPVTYSYGQEYRAFILKIFYIIKGNNDNDVQKYFDIELAIRELEAITGETNEEQMHKFSNIIQLYLQLNEYN